MTSIRISATIDKIDLDFCKARGYKPSRLLRAKIKELMNRDNDIDYKQANATLQARIMKLNEFLEIAGTENARLQEELKKKK